METIKKTLRKVTGGRFVAAVIELEDGRLSITGATGRVVSRKTAKAEARRYWEGFFEESPQEIFEMNQRQGTRFTSAKDAARYVQQEDGDFHGLDVHGEDESGRILVTESYGCIHDTLRKAFPELADLIPWHLNDLKAGCEHQEALGWGHGHDVALSKDDLTPAQRESLTAERHRQGERARGREVARRMEEVSSDRGKRRAFLQLVLGHDPSVDEFEALIPELHLTPFQKEVFQKVHAYLERVVLAEIPDPKIESTVYKDSLCAPCPTCGYRYGTQWLKRELPPEVVAKVQALKGADHADED